MANERYFRQHPEISSLIGLFVRKILDDRPDNILEYAGTFFDRAELKDVVEQAIEQERREAARNEHLNKLLQIKNLPYSLDVFIIDFSGLELLY